MAESWANNPQTLGLLKLSIYNLYKHLKSLPQTTVQIRPQAPWKCTSHVQDGTSLPTKGEKKKIKSRNSFWLIFLKEEILKFSIAEHSCVVSELQA